MASLEEEYRRARRVLASFDLSGPLPSVSDGTLCYTMDATKAQELESVELKRIMTPLTHPSPTHATGFASHPLTVRATATIPGERDGTVRGTNPSRGTGDDPYLSAFSRALASYHDAHAPGARPSLHDDTDTEEEAQTGTEREEEDVEEEGEEENVDEVEMESLLRGSERPFTFPVLDGETLRSYPSYPSYPRSSATGLLPPFSYPVLAPIDRSRVGHVSPSYAHGHGHVTSGVGWEQWMWSWAVAMGRGR